MIFEYKEKFYYCTVLQLIASNKDFQENCLKSCPTMWGDGTKCSIADDISNKASMEVDLLIDLDLI